MDDPPRDIALSRELSFSDDVLGEEERKNEQLEQKLSATRLKHRLIYRKVLQNCLKRQTLAKRKWWVM